MITWFRLNLKGDTFIWGVIAFLSMLSLLAVYSSTGMLAYRKADGNTEAYLIKHGALLLVGLACTFFVHKIDYRYFSGLSMAAIIISIPLLLWALVFGTRTNDASRWILIPIINQTFQPSDLAKLALISRVATMLSINQQHIGNFWKTIFPILAITGLICGLIALSNFSTAIMLALTVAVMMFVGRVPLKYFAILAIVLGTVGVGAFSFGQRGKTLTGRIQRFMSGKELDYQAEQSYIAVSTGGFFGKGPGNSQQKDFLPHPYSDFIYAIVIEEYGMLIGSVVVGCYIFLFFRGIENVTRSSNAFGGLLAAGLTFSLVSQAMLHMAVSVGLAPITGQPLPLLSMGGTSLLFTGMAFGIILSVSRGETDLNLGKPAPRHLRQ